MDILVDNANSSIAVSLSQRFGFTLVETSSESSYLCFENGQLALKGSQFFIKVDFVALFKRLSSQRLSLRKDLLARSLGLDKNPGALIFDATMGLAKDSFHLSYLGANVIATERDPVPFSLVESAIGCSTFPAIKGSLTCHFGDASDYLEKTDLDFRSLYLDPMFEEVEKKSLPKKEMQFLRSRQRGKTDYTNLIEVALNKGIERVVVKRSLNGPELYPGPQSSLVGKMIRYDIYRKGNLI